MIIMIDAGHGGNDPGAVAPTKQREDRTNFNVTEFLGQALGGLGTTVIKTRTAHTQTVSLAARQSMIIKNKPALVISIHHNGCVNQTAHGAEIIAQINSVTGIYDDKSYKLAACINAEFKKLGQDIRGIIRKANSAGNADYYGLLRTAAACKIPAVITEYAFMTRADVTDVDTLSEQRAEADAIARGIMAYIK